MPDLFMCWLGFVAGGLIAGHARWGRRWMIDGTRGIVAVYASLWRALRRKSPIMRTRLRLSGCGWAGFRR